MNIVQQSTRLPIVNVAGLFTGNQTTESRHGELLPDSVRALIVGPSGCGKTNVVMSLLTTSNGLKFENVYLYSTTEGQPMYMFLKNVMKDIIPFYSFSQHDTIVPPSEAKSNSVFVFDDIATEKQDCIKAYFATGRHKHTDVLYLCQTYTKIPKQLIRDNANMVIFFRQDDNNLEYIYNEHVGNDFTSFRDFKTMCSQVWNENPFSFCVIDKTRPPNHGKYRAGFDRFIEVKSSI